MKLKELAHARAGDKGNTCNICIVPYNTADYALLKQELTTDRIRAFFADICNGDVARYEVDSLCSLNFVLKKSLGGGVTRSLAVDKHGKSLGMALLELEL